MDDEFDELKAKETLEKGYEAARNLLKERDKLEKFLQRLEQKLRVVPLVGDVLASLPIMASLIKSFIKKEYSDVPIGSIIAIVSALSYFLSPIDIIPDVIPGVGYIDDALVITACLKLVASDLDEYVSWRNETEKLKK